MELLKEYKSEHYANYSEIADGIISDAADVNALVCSITNKTLLIWLRSANIMLKSKNKYFNETATMLTLVIKLFRSELGVEFEIKLNDDEIIKIFNRFHHILKEEFIFRRKLKERKQIYTLLRDFNEKKSEE